MRKMWNSRKNRNPTKKNNIIYKFIYWLTIPNKYCRSFCVTCKFWEICQTNEMLKEKKEWRTKNGKTNIKRVHKTNA